VGGTCSTHGRGEMFTRFWLGGPKGRNQREDLGVGGRITLRSRGIDGANWIQLAQDRVQWVAFVSRLLFDKVSDYQLSKEYPVQRSK
jgi:hypothetical protein